MRIKQQVLLIPTKQLRIVNVSGGGGRNNERSNFTWVKGGC